LIDEAMQPVKAIVILCCLLATGLCLSSRKLSQPDLVSEFEDPPASSKPWTYWFFYNDHISREGIDLDLAAMKEADIGTALLFTHVSHGGNTGKVKALTPEWWDLVKYAIRRAGEEGIDLGLFNCFGWSQSGGPWNSLEQTMRHLVAPEVQVSGPAEISMTLPAPAGFYQDVRVLAFPTPAEDHHRILKDMASISGKPGSAGLRNLIDGDTSTVWAVPEEALAKGGSMLIDIRTNIPFPARSLRLYPSDNQFVVDCELQAKNSQGRFESIRKFQYQRPPGGGIMDIGPLYNGPASISFPALESDHFRLIFKNFSFHPHFGRAGSQPGFREIELSGAFRLDHYVEKQLSKVFPMPQPQWDSYLWEGTNPADDPDLLIPEDRVLDISERMDNGTLNWSVPGGQWTILRVCMVPTGAINAPVLPEAEGPEIDKLSRKLAFHQFDGFAGRLLGEMPEAARTALKYLVIDSYEKGSQNWTDSLEIPFREAFGYDPIPYLPVLSGRAVGSAERSERFMWDLRRLVADRVSFEYIGGLREISNRHGLKLWVENYGHWGFPGEMLQYGGQADIVSGEFWTRGTLGSIELRAAASSAHTYGKRIVCAESFTSSAPHYISHPWFLKLRGDWSFCEGVNLTLLTEYLHQPYKDRVPGVNAWFGTAFNRNNTWFSVMDSWVLYEERCNFMLQQGLYVADLAYFIGEDAPKMAGITDPPPPPGHAFDLINGDVIQERLEVRDGRFFLPDGMSYKLLVLPPLDNMRPELLAKIGDMVRAGGCIYGRPPGHSPSLENYPDADRKVRELAREIWQDCDGVQVTSAELGRGRVFRGLPLDQVLEELGTGPDVILAGHPEILWIHRSAPRQDIYFLSNQREETVSIAPEFRMPDPRQPEFWDAITGSRKKTALFTTTEDGIRVPLALGPRASIFVVFSSPPGISDPLHEITRDGEPVMAEALLGARGIVLHLRENGRYTLQSVRGRSRTVEVNGIPDPVEVTGPWEVRFTPGWGAPESIVFNELTDWTESADPGIKYYSGQATYHARVDLPQTLFTDGNRILIDLGDVGNIAGVTVNSEELGHFWHFPMEVDITGVARSGENDLAITVTSTWRNRLVGDARYPGQARTWLATDLRLTGDEALVPSGLIGPVLVKVEKTIQP
jgi:hypothetical protein